MNETPPVVTISPVVEDKPVFKKEEDEEDLNIGSFTGIYKIRSSKGNVGIEKEMTTSL